jgi:hypothetical protein
MRYEQASGAQWVNGVVVRLNVEALGDECEVMGWRLCGTKLPFVFRPSSLSLIPKSHLTVTFDE